MAVQNIPNTNTSGVKTIGPGIIGQNASNTAITKPDELKQLSPQEAAQLEKLQAGQAILDSTAENIKENTETQKETDRAELESKNEPEQQSKQTVDDRIWDSLQRWRPVSGLSVEKNLNQIQDIFQSLLKEIMSNYDGTLQLSLLAQLDTYTMNALQQLMNERFQELLTFMQQYGRPTDPQSMANGLFEDISGRRPLTNLNAGTSAGGMTFTMQNSAGKLFSGETSQGMIYQKDSRSVRINESYQNSVGKSERSGPQAAIFLQRGGYYNGTKAFSPYDIKQSQSFVQYLKENFPGLEPGKAAYTSEEYLGVSAGILSLKTLTFAAQKGLSPEAAAALKYAVNTYIQEHFMQNSQNLRQVSGAGSYGASGSLQADDFQKIYRYIVNSYNEKNDAQAAVLNGLQKAYESFSAKQTSPVWQLIARYAPDLGFFSRTPVSDLEKELSNGWRAICKDWNDFLQYAQIAKEKSQRFDYIQNREYYLASLLASERSASNRSEKKQNILQNMTKWGIALVLAGIIAAFVFLYFSRSV